MEMTLKNNKKISSLDIQSKNSISEIGQKIAKDWFDAAIKRDVPEDLDDKDNKKKSSLNHSDGSKKDTL